LDGLVPAAALSGWRLVRVSDAFHTSNVVTHHGEGASDTSLAALLYRSRVRRSFSTGQESRASRAEPPTPLVGYVPAPYTAVLSSYLAGTAPTLRSPVACYGFRLLLQTEVDKGSPLRPKPPTGLHRVGALRIMGHGVKGRGGAGSKAVSKHCTRAWSEACLAGANGVSPYSDSLETRQIRFLLSEVPAFWVEEVLCCHINDWSNESAVDSSWTGVGLRSLQESPTGFFYGF